MDIQFASNARARLKLKEGLEFKLWLLMCKYTIHIINEGGLVMELIQMMTQTTLLQVDSISYKLNIIKASSAERLNMGEMVGQDVSKRNCTRERKVKR